MHIEQRPISSIRPYENNPRLNDAAVKAVAASIREFGFRQPLVVDEDGVLIVGHTRFKAALKLGLEFVPVHVAVGLSPAQVKAFRLADNQTASLAAWDGDKLAQELAALQEMTFDLSQTGFSADDLLRLMDSGTNDGLTDADAMPEPPAEATTRPGDLWILGEHRLLCGVSSQPEAVDRLLAAAPIHLVHTDLRCQVQLEPRSKNACAASLSPSPGGTLRPPLDHGWHPEKAKPTSKMPRAKDPPLADAFVSDQDFDRLLRACCGNLARVLVPGRAYYLWAGHAHWLRYPPALEAAGLYVSQVIIRATQHVVPTGKDYQAAHACCLYGWRDGAPHEFFGPASATDRWSVKKVKRATRVPLTEPPVELVERAIEYSSRPGEHVLDLFAGGGSTLIAAERTGRRAYLLAPDPLQCDVVIRRFEQFAGKQATRTTR